MISSLLTALVLWMIQYLFYEVRNIDVRNTQIYIASLSLIIKRQGYIPIVYFHGALFAVNFVIRNYVYRNVFSSISYQGKKCGLHLNLIPLKSLNRTTRDGLRMDMGTIYELTFSWQMSYFMTSLHFIFHDWRTFLNRKQFSCRKVVTQTSLSGYLLSHCKKTGMHILVSHVTFLFRFLVKKNI